MYKVLKKKIVSVLVLNQANVLTRVVSLFGRRGFNIDSLTVSATNDPTLSRITIVFSATERSMQQIITQTAKLEVVKSIFLLDRENSLYRELLLLKVNATSEQRRPIKEIVDIYRGKIIDLSKDSMIIELTGTPEKLDGFMEVMKEHHHDIASFRSFFDSHYRKTCCLSLCFVLRACPESDNNIHSAVVKIHRMRMTLAAKADNRYRLSIKQTQITILIVILFNHFISSFLL